MAKDQVVINSEVADLRWPTTGEIRADPVTPPWISASIERVEAFRTSH